MPINYAHTENCDSHYLGRAVRVLLDETMSTRIARLEITALAEQLRTDEPAGCSCASDRIRMLDSDLRRARAAQRNGNKDPRLVELIADYVAVRAAIRNEIGA